MVHSFAVIVFAALAASAVLGCSSGHGYHSPTLSANTRVKNGVAFEIASLPLAGAASVVLPGNATVTRSNGSRNITVFIEKRLSYMGHPVNRITIEDVQKKLVLSSRRENMTVFFATAGEWMTPEGGASMELLFVIPEAVSVRQLPGLSGPGSCAEIDSPSSGTNGWQALATRAMTPDEMSKYSAEPETAGAAGVNSGHRTN